MANCRVSETFGSMVFNEAVMKERLPRDIYKALKPLPTAPLELDVVNVAASVRRTGQLKRCYSFHSLVSAHDRCYGRKA